jgi:hypothetical protein
VPKPLATDRLIYFICPTGDTIAMERGKYLVDTILFCPYCSPTRAMPMSVVRRQKVA